MKHTWHVTGLLVLVFFVSQLVGLAIVNKYVDHKEVDLETGKVKVVYEQLPLNIERPPVNEDYSYLFIIGAVLLGTVLALLLIRFRTVRLWRMWFFLSVVLCLTIAFKPYIGDLLSYFGPAVLGTKVFGMRIPEWIALLIAATFAYFKIFRPGVIVSNMTEVFIYGGLSAIFVPIISIKSAIILLILISLYDMYAVWRSQHMVKLATFQRDSKVFAGLSIPYSAKGDRLPPAPKTKHKSSHHVQHEEEAPSEEVRTAILGGGDIGFPMFFAGVVMKTFSYLETLIIPVCVTISLFLLLTYGKANKFYPAMPYLTFGCFVGYGLVLVLF